MVSGRRSHYEDLEAKVAAIRAGAVKDSLSPAEAISFACAYHKSNDVFEPITLTRLSALISPTGRTSYLNDAFKDINVGKCTRLPKSCAAFMANVTGKDIEFWRRESYTLADVESIQITLPHEVKPEPTIARPATHSQGVRKLPTARELAEAVLFPPDLTSTNIAQRMKDNSCIKR